MFNLVQPLPRFLPLSEGSGQIVTPQNSASYSLVLCSISAFPMHHSYYGTCLHLQPQEPVRSYTVLRALQLCFGKSYLNTRPCCIKMLLYLKDSSLHPAHSLISSSRLKSRTQDFTFAVKIFPAVKRPAWTSSIPFSSFSLHRCSCCLQRWSME